MSFPKLRPAAILLALLPLACASPRLQPQPTPMPIYYLEIVTPDVESTCASLAAVHGYTFSEPDPSLGGARTTKAPDGSTVGVRTPMHADEIPTTRPYRLVPDIQAAIAAAEANGAELIVPAMEIPGHGIIAIYHLGLNQYGLWQNFPGQTQQ
ncbi:MAG: hydroxylase [Planctomycetota bacterium]